MDLALTATQAAPPCVSSASSDPSSAEGLTAESVETAGERRRLYVVSTAAFDISGGGLAALAQFVAGTAEKLGTLMS